MLDFMRKFAPFAVLGVAVALSRPSRKSAPQPPRTLKQKAFYASTMAALAAPICARYQVPLSVCVAVATHETDWGRAVPGQNHFGIKGKGPAGSVAVNTHEEVNGRRVAVVAKFRKYHDTAESIEDYCKFVTSGRYRNAAGRTPALFLLVVWADGYATSRKYVQSVVSRSRKIAGMLNRPDLAIEWTPLDQMKWGALAALPPQQRRLAIGV